MDSLKRIVFALFPNALLKLIKKHHFYLKIKRAKVSDDEDLLMLENLIKPNAHVIDIGANIGWFTKFLSTLVGPQGRVLSFEPIPETYHYLQNNILKLNLKNVLALNAAVSDHNGKATMQIPKFDHNRLNFYEAAIIDNPNGSLPQLEVDTGTLDDFCIRYNITPSFVKCDVEGHEWSVLKGSEDTITRYMPIVLVEINPDLTHPDPNTSHLLNFMHKKGYHIFINHNNQLKKWESEKKVNYYFMTDEHLLNLKEIIANY